MQNIKKEISRRNLLRFLGNSAVALPFMRTLLETQAFGQSSVKRAVFFYYPDGIIREEFHPSTVGSGFTLPAMTAPLEAVRNDIIMLKGVNYRTSNSHQGGINYSLTGMPDSKPGLSIDTYLGEKFKAQIPALRLGISSQFEGADAAHSASFFAPGSPSLIEDNPTKAFQQLFGSTSPAPAGSPASVASIGLSNSLKKSLLDSNLQQIKALQNALGSIEKAKLDLHIESVRELERRLQAAEQGGGGAGAPSAQCTRSIAQAKTFALNDPNYPKEFWKFENYDVVSDMMNEIAIQALACGVTRVVYIQNSHSVSNVNFSGGTPVANGVAHHSSSHYGGEGNRAQHIQGQAYMMSKFAKLVGGLAAIKEGDKSMLFNTAAMAFSELADSDKHDFTSVGLVLAGQAGGAFSSGRCVDAAGASHNQVLVSILQAMGLSDQTFGQTDLGSGALPGLKG